MLDEFRAFKKSLPTVVGGKGVRFFKENFKRQGFLDKQLEPWQQRQDGTTEGVLIQSGNLRRSIRAIKRNEAMVSVGTYVPYAKIHNEGGEIAQKPTAKQRRFFWAKWFASGEKDERDDNWKGAALAKEINIKIPKRQFIGKSETLDDDIGDYILDELNNIL